MTDHLRRIRAYMEHETKALLLAAERARLLDHRGNRGSEVEHTIRSWIHERVSPNYAVSSGEIIDSYDTDAALDSRQQDGVVHTNDLEGRRFLLPSGLRLVPIETVAAVVEVKLTLTKQGVLDADAAAQQTARLKLSVREQPVGHPGAGGGHSNSAHAMEFNEKRAEHGVPLSDPIFAHRTSFAIIGIDGPQNVEVLAEWLKETTTINMIACLSAGCAKRFSPRGAPRGSSMVAQREEALLSFAQGIRAAISNFEQSAQRFSTYGWRYETLQALQYWDDSGYEFPEDYMPGPEQVELRARLFPGRTWRR